MQQSKDLQPLSDTAVSVGVGPRKRYPAANSGETAARVPEGRRFQPGQSGNPRGRPKRDHDVAELARTHTAGAIATLAEIMTDRTVLPAARVSAATALLDRGWGRAPQYGSLDVNVGLATEFENFVREIGRRQARSGELGGVHD